MKYTEWLVNQHNRNDKVGFLAKDFITDRKTYGFGFLNTFSFYNRLKRLDADDVYLEGFNLGLKEFLVEKFGEEKSELIFSLFNLIIELQKMCDVDNIDNISVEDLKNIVEGLNKTIKDVIKKCKKL